MLREFFLEYFRGIVASLQGFLVLHRLDRPTPNTKAQEETKRISREILSKQTVLENRRRKNLEGKAVEVAQREIVAKVSTVQRVFRCALINIASVLAVLLLTYLIDLIGPSLVSSFVKYIGSLLLLPIFLTVRLLSILWFADVAGAALKYRGISSNKIPDLSKAASDFIHAIFVELIFLVQSLLIFSLEVPLLSTVFGFIYMTLLHSLYSFDYIWMASGISLNKRLALIEQHWPFHLGFGTILTVATSISSNFVINGCIFGALFPFFIVSSFLTDAGTERMRVQPGEVPTIHFYYIAQTITNRLSIAFFGRIC